MTGLIPFFKTGRNMIKSFLHPEKGYEKGQEQLNKYYEQGQGYLSPYHQQGQQAYGQLNGAMNSLLNPEQLYDRFAQSYKTSGATRDAQDRARNSSLEAASSMGLMGSSHALNSLNAENQRIENEGMSSYIQNLIKQYLEGAGIAQNIYGQGAQAGGQLGQNAMMHGQNSANMAFGRQNAPGKLFGDLVSQGIGFALPYGANQGQQGTKPWSSTGGR